MKDVYAEFTGDELSDVLKAIRREENLKQAEKDLENKIVHFTKELGVVKEQQRTLRD